MSNENRMVNTAADPEEQHELRLRSKLLTGHELQGNKSKKKTLREKIKKLLQDGHTVLTIAGKLGLERAEVIRIKQDLDTRRNNGEQTGSTG